MSRPQGIGSPWKGVKLIGGVLVITFVSLILRPVLEPWSLEKIVALGFLANIAVFYGPASAIIGGAMLGLLLDILGDSVIGVDFGALALSGYIFARTAEKMKFLPLPARIPFIAVTSIVYLPISILLLALAGVKFGGLSWPQAGNFTVGNAACAAALLLIFLSRIDVRDEEAA